MNTGFVCEQGDSAELSRGWDLLCSVKQQYRDLKLNYVLGIWKTILNKKRRPPQTPKDSEWFTWCDLFSGSYFISDNNFGHLAACRSNVI